LATKSFTTTRSSGRRARDVVRLHLKAGMLVGFFPDKWRFLKRSAPIELGGS
jgi:hypothetical protein